MLQSTLLNGVIEPRWLRKTRSCNGNGNGNGLQRPLFLAACYLPPFRSKYGLGSAQQLEDYFTGLGDEVAAAMADPGGADVLLAGDLNADRKSVV